MVACVLKKSLALIEYVLHFNFPLFLTIISCKIDSLVSFFPPVNS